jgi:hypothetical protein
MNGWKPFFLMAGYKFTRDQTRRIIIYTNHKPEETKGFFFSRTYNNLQCTSSRKWIHKYEINFTIARGRKFVWLPHSPTPTVKKTTPHTKLLLISLTLGLQLKPRHPTLIMLYEYTKTTSFMSDTHIWWCEVRKRVGIPDQSWWAWMRRWWRPSRSPWWSPSSPYLDHLNWFRRPRRTTRLSVPIRSCPFSSYN